MKKIVAGMLAAVMSCALLVGCGDSKYVGKYTAEMMGTKATLELKDDHKAKFMGEGGAKWEVDGDKIVLSDEKGKVHIFSMLQYVPPFHIPCCV